MEKHIGARESFVNSATQEACKVVVGDAVVKGDRSKVTKSFEQQPRKWNFWRQQGDGEGVKQEERN